MKFRSRNKKPIRIASTMGHIVIVDQEWLDVPGHMEGDAYAKGCISEEMYDTIKGLDAPEIDVTGKIRESINAMIDSPEGSFTAAGMPNLKILSDRCGFTVTKDVMLPLWEEVSAERDEQEGDQ